MTKEFLDEKRKDNISKLIAIGNYVKKCDTTKCASCIFIEECAALLETLELFTDKLKLNNTPAN